MFWGFIPSTSQPLTVSPFHPGRSFLIAEIWNLHVLTLHKSEPSDLQESSLHSLIPFVTHIKLLINALHIISVYDSFIQSELCVSSPGIVGNRKLFSRGLWQKQLENAQIS